MRRPPRKAWPLARVLNALLIKMGRTGLLAEPRRGPQAGKSGDPRSQNADSCQDMHGFETRLSDICYVDQEPRRTEGKGYGAPSDNTT